jgi:hypothetical protein
MGTGIHSPIVLSEGLFWNIQKVKGCPSCKNFKNADLEKSCEGIPVPQKMLTLNPPKKDCIDCYRSCNLATYTSSGECLNEQGESVVFKEKISDTLEALDASLFKPALKNSKELRNYLSCYRSDTVLTDSEGKSFKDGDYCIFKESEPYIAYASALSGIPYSVQACLYMKEMNYIPATCNSIPACGLIQFTEGAAQEVNDLLEGSAKSFETSRKSLERAGKYSSAKVSQAHYEARKVWDQIWEGTKGIPGPRSIFQMTETKDEAKIKLQMDQKLKDLKRFTSCPKFSFFASAVKQVHDAFVLDAVSERVSAKFDQHKLLTMNGMNPTETALVLAGAYNMGPGNFAKCCSGTQSVLEFIGNKRAPEESRNHVKQILNCAEKGSERPINSKQRDCSASRCEK